MAAVEGDPRQPYVELDRTLRRRECAVCRPTEESWVDRDTLLNHHENEVTEMDMHNGKVSST